MANYKYTLEKITFDNDWKSVSREVIEIQADGVVWEDNKIQFFVVDTKWRDKTTVAVFSVRDNVEINITSLENNNA